MDKTRIRIKIPSGAEFEAEGTESFVLSEKDKFLIKFADSCNDKKNENLKNKSDNNKKQIIQEDNIALRKTTGFSDIQEDAFNAELLFPVENNQEKKDSSKPKNDWELVTRKGKNLHYVIISKDKSIQAADAVLVLLAAEQRLAGNFEIPALILTGMLKSSGFVIHRLDRLLQQYMNTGYIKYTGTKRSRMYSLTEKGFQKAALLAHIMANV